MPPPPAPPAKKLPEDNASVRVQIRKLSYKLASSLRALPGEGRFQTLAVLSFSEEGEETRRREVGKLVAAELATNLRRDHGLNLVERERIEAALHEGYLNEMGLVDEKSAVKLGEMLSAQALVVGNVSLAGTDFLVNARVVSTETGEVFFADQERIPAHGLVSFASEAVVLRTRSGAVFRSMVMPGWGQFYNRQEGKGWAILGLETVALGSALSLHLAGSNAHSRYLALNDPAANFDQHLNTERDFYTARNVMLGVAAAVWAFNVVDALLNGKTFDPARAGD